MKKRTELRGSSGIPKESKRSRSKGRVRDRFEDRERERDGHEVYI